MPTVDIEPRGNLNMCKFDIFHDEDKNKNCATSIEYTPVKVNPDKLKQYIVPYIEMTHEDLKANTEK